MNGLIDFQLTRWFSDEFRASHPDVLKRVTDIFIANDLNCYAASCGLLGNADSRPHLGSFRMPVAIHRWRGRLRDAGRHGQAAARGDCAVDTDRPSSRAAPHASGVSG
jgi:hypothetical protein